MQVRDLGGVPLTVYAFKYEPSVLAEELENGTLINVGGLDGNVCI